jgi:glycosyltransferase involved in cell wall biosynthesis
VGHNIQLIIVDDSSNFSINNKKEILNSGLKQLSIVESTKRNPGGTRNIGFEEAKGKTVIFWDSDDLPDINNLIAMNSKLMLSNYDLIIGGFNFMQENVLQKYVSPSTNSYKLIKNPGVWRVLFKREFISKVKFIDCRIGEDQIFLANILDMTSNIGTFDKNVYNYNQTKNGITSSSTVVNDLKRTLSILNNIKLTKSSNLRVVYFNLLLSYLVRTNFISFNKSLQALNNSRKIFGNSAFCEIAKALIKKILHK